MKFIKTMILAGFLLGTAGMCLQAQEKPQDLVIQGKKAKMTVFESLRGSNYAKLSRNEKYIYGDIEAGEAGYIYEIATGKLNLYEGFGIVEVIDTNNYVATNHIMRNGVRIEFDKKNLPTDAEHDYGATLANDDLSVISYDTYIGANYVSVLFNGQGKIIDTMPHFEPGLGAGYGSFVLDMSADGKILSGRTSMESAHTNFTPAIWNRDAHRTIATTGSSLEGLLDGSLYGINAEGTIATGEIAEKAYWISYDKTNHSYELHLIPSFPGYQKGWGGAIQGDIVMGIDQLDNVSVYERVPWLYNIKTQEKVSLHDHLLYRYGLEESEDYVYFTPISISKDHKTIVGYSYNVAWYPYMIQLEDEQVHPMVRNVSIWQPYKASYVQIQWEAPINGDYTVAGYRIYCDSVLIETINNPQTLSYRHEDITTGIHNYQVQAFYTDGEASDYSGINKIFLVEENGCLPVQEINAEVIYNRTISLSWGRPSANINPQSAAPVLRTEERTSVAKGGTEREPKYMVDGKLDYVSMINTLSEHTAVGVRVGNYLYLGNYRTNTITVYDAISGNQLKIVEVDNLYGMYDMAYHNHTLYCVGATSKDITMLNIDEKDPFKITPGGTIKTSLELTHISYLEGLNDGEDMIMTGSFNSIVFYKGDAVVASDTANFHKKFDIKGMTIIGTAYHDGRLFIANQHDGNSSMIETFDWETGKHLFTTDLVAIPAVAEAVSASMGYSALMSGISIGKLDDGTVVLDAMIQPLTTYNHLVTVEVESSPDVKGYIVYRDGVKVSDTVKARHFSEDIFEPGKYVYTVEYFSNNGCSMKSDGFAEDSATINPIGTCMPPTQVAVFESNHIACLSWDFPVEYTDPDLVGFNVYRDGEKFCDKLLDLRFNDESIEKGKEYIYRVEAFYNNSCVSSDSVKITPTFEGYAAAPSAVAVKENKNGDVRTSTTTWELPNFEEPLALGYCGGIPGGSVNLEGTNTVYGLIGWTQQDNDLEPYKDLYIVGIEFMIGAPVQSINGVVYIDDRLVWSEPMNRVGTRVWHKHFFKKSFSMDQKVEIATGYAFSFDPETTTDGIVVYDLGPAVVNKGDIISPDGVQIYSLKATGPDANLMINALVVHKRDLEEASKMNNGMEYLKTKAFSTGSLKITEPTPIENAPKSTSESYTLKGFNVYRDGEKRNAELLRGFSFEDQGLDPEAEYEYVVSAVYADQEVKSEGVWLTPVANRPEEAVCPVSFQPNPVQDMLYIKGEYASLSLIDMTGRVVLSDVRNVQSLPMANFQSGIYFVKVTTENGKVYITKIVKK